MATATPPRAPSCPPAGEQRLLLRGIPWATFQALAEALGDDPPVRLAYNKGDLELMSPGPFHEFDKKLFARLVEVLTEEMDMPAAGMGSTRWEAAAAERSLEPDECYYLTPEKVAAGGRKSNKVADYPTADLAIEIEYSRPKVDRMEIYASLGVPEVWRFDGRRFRFFRLQPGGDYAEAPDSLFLPIRPDEVLHWLIEVESADQTRWARQLRAWARDELATRPRPGAAGG